MKTSKLPLWLYKPGLRSIFKRTEALYKQVSLLPPKKLYKIYIPSNATSSDLLISFGYDTVGVDAELTYTVWNADRTKILSTLSLGKLGYLRGIGAWREWPGNSKEEWEKSRELFNMMLNIIESEVKSESRPTDVRDVIYDRLVNHQTLSTYTYLTENGESVTVPAGKK